MTTNIKDPLINVISSSAFDRRRHWYVFRAYNLYRLILIAILLSIFFLGGENSIFGKEHPDLFIWTTLVYIFIIFLAMLGSVWRRPSLKLQAHIQIIVPDCRASGPTRSGSRRYCLPDR
jgi:hypothetical protein